MTQIVKGDGERSAKARVDAGDEGYSKALKARHINMIAIGGAIGWRWCSG